MRLSFRKHLPESELNREDIIRTVKLDELPATLIEEMEQRADARWKNKLRFDTLLGLEQDNGQWTKILPWVSTTVSVLTLVILFTKK